MNRDELVALRADLDQLESNLIDQLDALSARDFHLFYSASGRFLESGDQTTSFLGQLATLGFGEVFTRSRIFADDDLMELLLGVMDAIKAMSLNDQTAFMNYMNRLMDSAIVGWRKFLIKCMIYGWGIAVLGIDSHEPT
jgi:hypothetical protein